MEAEELAEKTAVAVWKAAEAQGERERDLTWAGFGTGLTVVPVLVGALAIVRRKKSR